jgi:N,N'-diacetyllegionaminate synthase
MSTSFTIGERRIGPGERCLIIAEVAQAHDGSLGTAHAYIDAVSNAGADAVKFQTHIAEAESTPDEPWRVRFSPQEETRFDYWRRMEFTADQWNGLAKHCAERGLLFLSSPFSLEAVELLDRIGMAAWKVASGEVANLPLLDEMIARPRPFLLSSGMSSWDELDTSVRRIEKAKLPVAIMQCTSSYPTPPEQVGLNLLEEMRQRYDRPVGLSDHSGTIFPSLAAATLGANVIEVHVTMSREMFGPDVVASVTTAELADLVRGVHYIDRMLTTPVSKDAIADEMAPLREIFMRSVVARSDLPPGTRLGAEHLAAKKPGTGIPAGRLPELYGRILARAVVKDQLLVESDMESA